ncbi:MAG: DUF1804 family protein [Methylotenera sp.]|jgi:uncharacterized protein YjcR|nr:DUF1804 family protein [Methylotenera sp.]
MAHSQQTKDNVRRLYIEGMPLNGAAIASGVSYDTAREWKRSAKQNGDDWDTARAAYQISEQGVDDLTRNMIESMMRQGLVISREIETGNLTAVQKVQIHASLSDSMSKFSKSMSRINPKLGALSISLDTLKTIAEYLSKHDKTALASFQEHLEGIGAILQARYS